MSVEINPDGSALVSVGGVSVHLPKETVQSLQGNPLLSALERADLDRLRREVADHRKATQVLEFRAKAAEAKDAVTVKECTKLQADVHHLRAELAEVTRWHDNQKVMIKWGDDAPFLQLPARVDRAENRSHDMLPPWMQVHPVPIADNMKRLAYIDRITGLFSRVDAERFVDLCITLGTTATQIPTVTFHRPKGREDVQAEDLANSVHKLATKANGSIKTGKGIREFWLAKQRLQEASDWLRRAFASTEGKTAR